MEGRSLALHESGRALTVATEQCPHLVALSTQDALATGIVLYYLHTGTTVLGIPNSSPIPDIEISGEGVTGNHCSIEYDGGEVVQLIPGGGECLVNGKVVTAAVELVQGQMLQLGTNNVFRFNNPAQVPPHRHSVPCFACLHRISLIFFSLFYLLNLARLQS